MSTKTKSYNVPIWYDHRHKCYKRGSKIIKGPYKRPKTNEEKLNQFILEDRFQESLNDPSAHNHNLVQLLNIARNSFTHLNPVKEVKELKRNS